MAAVVKGETRLSLELEVLASAVGVVVVETHVFSSLVAAKKLHRASSSRLNALPVCLTWVKCSGTHQDRNLAWWKSIPEPTVYLYSGTGDIEEVDSTGSVLARYTQDLAIDEPLAQSRANAIGYYQADGVGSISSLTNSAGTPAATYQYDSFGNQLASTGSTQNPFHYTARESDAETGIYYYRARYYDSTIGRFLSEDPLKFGATSNFYPYAANNSLRYNDPMGTCIVDVYFERTGQNADGSFFHTFIVLIDNSGKGNPWPREFRGGPSENGGPGARTVVEAELDDLRVAPDKPSEAVASAELIHNGCSCSDYEITLQELVATIDHEKTEYGWSNNSNSVTSRGIAAMGLPLPPVPPGVGILPGWGNSNPPAGKK
jgi:RHS repeat-associated protein